AVFLDKGEPAGLQWCPHADPDSVRHRVRQAQGDCMDVDPDPLAPGWLKRRWRRRLCSPDEEVAVPRMEPTIVSAELPVMRLEERIALDTQTGCQPKRHSA